MNFTKRTTLWYILIFIIPTSVFATERPVLYDFSLPFPKSRPHFASEMKQPYFTYEQLVPMIMYIDENGNVNEIITEKIADTIFSKYVNGYLTSFEFEPAVFKNKDVSSQLPVLVQFSPRVRSPDFYFPVDCDLSVKDQDLYFKAIELNDIELPYLISFPSFYCDLQRSDTVKLYPIILLKLTLDESGKLVDIVQDYSTYPSFNSQLMSAALYAEFSPAKVRGKAVSSETYLLISFFYQTSYPTQEWTLADYNEMNIFKRYQVRLIPAKVGLMSKPISKRSSVSSLSSTGIPEYFRGTVSVALTIESSGSPTINRLTKVKKDVMTGIKKLLYRTKFFPAVDYESKPVPFSGLIMVEVTSRTDIRIRYVWLTKEH